MMPAGTYYIGDLCYVMHPEWDEFCDITINDHECLDGEFNLKDGRRFATYGTAYGDGCYPTSIGARLGVDAGLIGCIKVEDIRDPSVTKLESYGTVVTFDRPFMTQEVNGTIIFGNVEVYTGDSEEDDYDPYEDD